MFWCSTEVVRDKQPATVVCRTMSHVSLLLHLQSFPFLLLLFVERAQVHADDSVSGVEYSALAFSLCGSTPLHRLLHRLIHWQINLVHDLSYNKMSKNKTLLMNISCVRRTTVCQLSCFVWSAVWCCHGNCCAVCGAHSVATFWQTYIIHVKI